MKVVRFTPLIQSLICVLIFFNVSAQVCLEDDFDPINNFNWNDKKNAYVDNQCGTYNGLGKALWFQSGIFSIADRYAETIALDVSTGGFIEFYLKMGDEIPGSGVLCGRGDSTNGESVFVKFNKTPYNPLNWYNPGNYFAEYKPQTVFDGNWVYVFLPIPPAAYSSATRFRFEQDRFLGNGYSNWSIDEVRISCVPPTIPPISNFDATPKYSCTGLVQFINLSFGNVDTSIWNYGDGTIDTILGRNTTTHSYQQGTFSVSLRVINAFGFDDSVKIDLIEIDTIGGPQTTPCIPQTNATCCSSGITKFSFGTINHISGDATNGVNGYEDFSCDDIVYIYAGASMPINITTGPDLVSQNVRAWIDYNNDQVFTSNEKVFSSDNKKLGHPGFVDVSPTATTNVLLRMRIANIPYGAAADINPCDTIDYGQYEDYGVIILDNPYSPNVDFVGTPRVTCDGNVSFEDLTSNNPTSWTWIFGDGDSAFTQNTTHKYLASGRYTVTLQSSNSFGLSTNKKTKYIKVRIDSMPVAPKCSPKTVFSNCLNYGIYNVKIDTFFQNPSSCGSESYQDFSCSDQVSLIEAVDYPITIITSPENPEDVKIWLDLNEDGTFDESEMVFLKKDAFNPSGYFRVPGLKAVYGNPIRMRVVSDYAGSIMGPCVSPLYGQIEDYTVYVIENPLPPVAGINGTSLTSCIYNPIQFSDSSYNAITSWTWDFGDGNTSTKRNPRHYYGNAGTYTVKLTVVGPYGTDNITKTNLVTIDPICEFTTAHLSSDYCEGILYDNGGPYNPYSSESDVEFLIAPKNATTVTLTFSQFIFHPEDSVYVYDGTSVNDPLLGAFNDSTALPPPLVATSGKMLIRQVSDDDWNTRATGFTAQWACTGKPYANFTLNPSMTDTCNDIFAFFDLSHNPTSWGWDFGDGNQDNIQHPKHTYSTANKNTFDVTLVATNSNGSDTAVKYFNNYHIVDVGFMKSVQDTIFLFPPYNGRVQFYDTSKFYVSEWLWDFGDGRTSTLKNPIYFYDSLGTFTVSLTVSNLCDTQQTNKDVIVSLIGPSIGINDVDTKNHFSVHPNPSDGNIELWLHRSKAEDITISVFNLLGERVYFEKVNNGLHLIRTLDLSTRDKGIYFIEVTGETQQFIEKIVIQ